MSIKNLIIVLMTHMTYQLLGILSVISTSKWVLALAFFIGITTYFTYRNLFQEKESALS